MRGDHHHAVDSVHPVNHHRRRLRKQHPATAFTSHSPESTTPNRPASRKVRQNPISGAHIGRAFWPTHPPFGPPLQAMTCNDAPHNHSWLVHMFGRRAI